VNGCARLSERISFAILYGRVVLLANAQRGASRIGLEPGGPEAGASAPSGKFLCGNMLEKYPVITDSYGIQYMITAHIIVAYRSYRSRILVRNDQLCYEGARTSPLVRAGEQHPRRSPCR
jgi:hypothetical protein